VQALSIALLLAFLAPRCPEASVPGTPRACDKRTPGEEIGA